jgi:hypothetical protein
MPQPNSGQTICDWGERAAFGATIQPGPVVIRWGLDIDKILAMLADLLPNWIIATVVLLRPLAQSPTSMKNALNGQRTGSDKR